PLVVSANSGNAVSVEQKFRSRKAGEHRYAGSFDFAAKPLNEAVQRDHIVAVIAQRQGRDRKLKLASFGEKVNRFLRYWRIERSFLFKSGQQFPHGPRIEQRTRKTVLPNLARLFEDVDIFFAKWRSGVARIMLINQLRKSQSGGHARRPAANDNDVGGHL